MKLWTVAAATALMLARPIAALDLPSPEAHFGFRMGADRQLASAEGIDQYFQTVAARSDRVRVIDLGPTTDGHRTPAAIISAPENIRNLESIRTANARLADPRMLAPAEARRLAATQKLVLAIGGSIHATEVGATQAACELLYSLATAADPQTLAVLDNVVVLLIPSLNPDGHRIVVDWYARQKGTPYEGGPLPWLYHRYAGHDLNRDAFMMNMSENRNLSRFFYTEWRPHVFLTMHQMTSDGPRFFVPPTDDPIYPNYDPLIWREAALLGSAMAFELQRDGRSGVMSNGLYDYYWPGYEDSAPLGHNIVSLLTEVASVHIATPVTLAFSELRGGLKGLPEYKPQINFPQPWSGGAWRLRDIVEYDLSAVRGLLYAASAYREQLVHNFYEMGRRAVDLGRRGGPFAFVIPPNQHDPHSAARLELLLIDAGIEIHRATEPFQADGDQYPAESHIILLTQPYRAYVKTLLERQDYSPRRLSPGGSPERPYDVVGWTLPQQMGVDVRTIARTFEPPPVSRLTTTAVASASVRSERKATHYLIDARGNGGVVAANRLLAAGLAVSWTTSAQEVDGFRYDPGSLIVPYSKMAEPAVALIARELGLRADGLTGKAPAAAIPIGRARVALYKPWTENIDEGWTRWLLEQYGFPFVSLTDAAVRAGSLRARYDVIILPSAPGDQLITGNLAGTVPPEFVGGLGEAGVDALKKFVETGGTLICLDQAGSLAISMLGLPIRDAGREAGDKLFCPGSLLRLDVDLSHPLAYGMRPQTAAFFAFSSAYDALPTRPSADGHGGSPSPLPMQVVARYGAKDLLLSGTLEGGDAIAGKPAIVKAAVGAGNVVLIGFPAQHRGQSHATFRFLFNAILAARLPS